MFSHVRLQDHNKNTHISKIFSYLSQLKLETFEGVGEGEAGLGEFESWRSSDSGRPRRVA